MDAAPLRFRLAVLAAATALLAAGPTRAQDGSVQTADAAIVGRVTSQRGVFVVAGATIVVLDAGGLAVAEAVSADDGRFVVAGLPAGRYRVEVWAAGFRAASRDASATASGEAALEVDLDVAAAERVAVVGATELDAVTGVAASTAHIEGVSGATIDEMEGVTDALRLLAGVSYESDGLSIRGGRANQTSLLLGGANVTEASTGTTTFRVPADAFASVDVLPNPYSVEYGRFSAGVALLETRRAGDRWRVRLNNFIPSLRTERGRPLSVLGIERFGPRLTLGGPLRPDRLYFAQAADYRYEALDIRSRPVQDLTVSHALNTLSRLDANLPGAHRLTAWVNLLTQRVDAANMDTFTPPEAAARVRERVVTAIVSDSVSLSESALLSGLLHVSDSTVRVGDGDGMGLEVTPEAVSGRFYNSQRRDTTSLQAALSASRYAGGPGGQHLLKAGVDVMLTAFAGESRSAPFTVRREDGSLARQLHFGEAARQRVSGADLALFVQDHWRPAPRLLLEGGFRLDRDGVLRDTNLSARLGAVALVTSGGAGVLRAGVGTFHERTPSIVGAFTQFEQAVETRFHADGTPVGPSRLLRHQLGGRLRSPSAFVWSIGYDQRIAPRATLRAGYLARDGRGVALVERIDGPSASVLELSSRGRSSYREVDVSLRLRWRPGFDLQAGYVRSSGRADLNDVGAYFGTLRRPLIGVGLHGATDVDVPHRLVARLRLAPSPVWLIAPVIEYRSGRPYSPADEYFDDVPRPQRPRFPDVTLVDVRVERQVRIGRWRPWVGVSCLDLLDTFDARDVQRSLLSPRYGEFFNALPRQVRLQLRFR